MYFKSPAILSSVRKFENSSEVTSETFCTISLISCLDSYSGFEPYRHHDYISDYLDSMFGFLDIVSNCLDALATYTVCLRVLIARLAV